MAKPSKSQWDFGELFPTEAVRKVLSVSELTGNIKRLLEKQVGQVAVSGEITNLRAQSSGHVYFTLKDAGAQLACVLFRNTSVPHRSLLADGQKVLLTGDVTIYEARGQYQLIVSSAELQGVGALQAAFERLKEKLAAEGLFKLDRKRKLPRYPQRIGLVTSPTGAAIRDVLHVIQRRQPGLEIIFVPCRVQGEGAALEVARAVRLLNQYSASDAEQVAEQVGKRESEKVREVSEAPSHYPALSLSHLPKLDLILVTRGGGSLEDLWAFNEEAVARAIFESAIPVVSAVGHEIDFTIADFVADLRAATPSAAAELITEGAFACREFVAEATSRLRQLAGQHLEAAEESFAQVRHRLALAHPRRRLQEWAQRLDDAGVALARETKTQLRERQHRFSQAALRLQRLKPTAQLAVRREQLAALTSRLRLLSPENVLARGYSITTDAATGKVIRSAEQTKPGQTLRTRVQHGEIESVVKGEAKRVARETRE
ncbi:MAG: exodeoxyribonuclease VII large subunit [Limisphaerales bacterium]|nr:MAG: exodeoxyribonuclease VII large subunit [Limisphaerales bacterium]KAG0509630.1 MAG: exodeoxyribonuclease VII large subunit [Limisphaerales bacterium]TXT49764.1 MAG: exodeoxyribonuclease VII large subunit [Limisphaerales bacterium]